MKKFLSLFCALAMMIALLSGISLVTYAAPSEEEWDRVFNSTMEKVFAEEDISSEYINVEREPVYDIDLAQLGFMYVMRYDDKQGYALVINTDGDFEVAEFYAEAENPFKSYEGKNVYVNFLLYLVYTDDGFVETETGITLTDSDIEVLREKAFGAANETFETGYETVYYTNKVINKYELLRHPSYYPSGDVVTNGCVPATGANIIGFWTRYYPELMPGFEPGYVLYGRYLYKEWATEADALVETLFYAMGTNSDAAGTTIREFRQGMDSYVSGKGRNIEYVSCRTNGSFNYSYTKQKLESDIPLALFVDCFRVDGITDYNGEMSLHYMISSTAHAMAGFGYRDITYTMSDGSQRTDSYIQVATGLVEKPNGYYNINYSTTIDECYAVRIY